MIITIAGLPGAGKTTSAKLVAQKLNYNFYSAGDIRGKYAQENGMTIDELNELSDKEPEWHTKVDKFVTELAERDDNFIMDSWMAWKFIPQSFKIFLKADAEVRAKRIFDQQQTEKIRPDERKYNDVQDVLQTLQDRVKTQNRQMLEIYGENSDFLDESHYDLVIDTTEKTPDEVVDEILAAIKDNKNW